MATYPQLWLLMAAQFMPKPLIKDTTRNGNVIKGKTSALVQPQDLAHIKTTNRQNEKRRQSWKIYPITQIEFAIISFSTHCFQ